MKFSRNNSVYPLSCTYDIEEATEELLAAIRRTSTGEKIVVEKRLRALWENTNGAERTLVAAIVNALGLPVAGRARIPHAYQVGFGAKVLNAVRAGHVTPMQIALGLEEPYSAKLGERVRSALKHLKARGLVKQNPNGEYHLPKPHPWSQRAVAPKRL